MSRIETVCAAARARFSELLEGDLGEEARRETEVHLAECAACAASFARFREAIAALGRLSSPEPPADLPSRIDRALDELAPAAITRAPAPGRRRLARHAVAALLVGGIIVGIIRVVPEVGGPLPARKAGSPAPAASPDAGEEAPAGGDRAALPIGEQAGARGGTAAIEQREAAPPGARSDEDDPGAGPARPDETRLAAGAVAEKAGRAPRAGESDERAQEAEAPAASATAAAPAMRDAMKRAAPAERKPPADTASLYAPREGEAGGGEYARGLLLAARIDAGWVAAVRDLALAHPDDLASAWAGLDADARATILAVWRRSPEPPGLRADLALAKARAGAPAGREIIEELIRALPPPEP